MYAVRTYFRLLQVKKIGPMGLGLRLDVPPHLQAGRVRHFNQNRAFCLPARPWPKLSTPSTSAVRQPVPLLLGVNVQFFVTGPAANREISVSLEPSFLIVDEYCRENPFISNYWWTLPWKSIHLQLLMNIAVKIPSSPIIDEYCRENPFISNCWWTLPW
jgi:hypothetical protein